jgi:long-chain acyl-CoA synthetase
MQISRLFDLINYQIANYDKEDALAQKINGHWKKYSSRDLKSIVDNLSLAFLKSGIHQDDKVAIISNNRPEWNFIDLALQQIGAISVPMYPTISADDYNYIFNHAEVKKVFVGDEEILEKAKEASKNMDVQIFSFDKISGCDYWEDFMLSGESGNIAELDSIKETIKTDDLFTIIYTSGTTGRPKGVMLTHGNVIHNLFAIEDRIIVSKGIGKALSFLPLCVIFTREQVLSAFCIWEFPSIMRKTWKPLETISKRFNHMYSIPFHAYWKRYMIKSYQKVMNLQVLRNHCFFGRLIWD